LTWYTLDDPNDPKLDDLAQQYSLHPLHIEDCRTHNERVKSEITDDYLFYILKYILSVDHGELTLGTLCLFVGRDYFITVQDGRHADDSVLERARKANGTTLSSTTQGSTTPGSTIPDTATLGSATPVSTRSGSVTPGKLMYLVLDTVVDSFFPSIDKSDDMIDEIEDRVLDNPSPQMVEQIFDQKRKLIELRRVLVNTREACNSMVRDSTDLISDDLYPFFRDVHDHVLRLLDSVEMLRDLLNNTLDVYLSSVANQTNQVVKVLTVLSTIALPGLVITSFYGMNVRGLPLSDIPFGAYYVAGAIIVSTVVMFAVMRKARWL
jgi:magnesium transporter